MQKKWDIITGLDACIDLVMSGNAVPVFGQVEKLVDQYDIEMGGSAPIFACQCAKLGAKTLGVGYRGDDAMGEMFERALLASGVDGARFAIDPRQKTGLGVLLVEGEDRAILTYSGTIDSVTIADFPDELLAQARHLHIASYFLMSTLRPDLPNLARRAKELGLTVSLDTNWDPESNWAGLESLFPYIDIFLPNEQERRALAGYDSLINEIPIVVVKRGEMGANAYLKDNTEYHAAAHAVPYADAIGAGDSFDGGFITAYLQGLSIKECLEAGCACGSANVRKPGGTAGQCDYDELKAMLSGREVSLWPR